MTLAPPLNAAGIVPPANPQNPPTLLDITNSREYVQCLFHSKKSQSPGAATDNQIGLAERYHQEVVLTNSLMGAAPPQWLMQLVGNVDQIRVTLENARIGRLNSMELIRNTGVTAYRAKQKEVAGDGTALANTLLPPGVPPLVALHVAPAIGTLIAPTINTHGLTHQAILQIIQYYNYHFEIQLGETVSIRSQKVANWLTMDV